MRRNLLFLLLAAGLWGGLCAGAQTRPNILLICVDDLKPALGCFGDPLAHTPNIDRLAARGMRFELAFCNQAVCAPSRNNLLTGARSTSLGVYSLSRPFRDAVPDAVTLPQYLMQHGWRTESIGKVLHTGHGNRDDAASWSVPPVHDKIVEYLDPKSSAGGKLTREEAYFSNQRLGDIRSLPRGAAWECLDVPDSAYADGRIADRGIQSLRDASAKPDQPFFLALGFVKPHLPFTAPKKYWDLHTRSAFPLPSPATPPEGAPPYAGKTLGELNNYDPVPQHPPLSDELTRTLIHGYYAATSFMDAQVGRVLDALDRLPLAEKTIVVLWGDNGWHLGDHGMWTKHTNYEQAARIPLIIVAPGVAAPGTRTRQLTETVDLYPTLCELAGLPPPRGPQPLDGVSLVPVLRNPSATVRDHAYHCFPREPRMGRAIRTERYRLVEWKVPGARANTADIELYDLTQDPLESRNIAAQETATAERLRAILARHPEAVPPGQAPPPIHFEKRAL